MKQEIPITNMFSAACYKFSKSTGKDTLYPVSSLDNGKNIKPFQIVVKSTKRKFIFWEKSTYEPTDFQITDVMTDMTVLKVATARRTFTDYKDNLKLSLKGKFGADICKELIDVELEASDSINLSVQFGKVIKTDVQETQLLEELNKRNINMDHQLIHEIRENKKKILCLITGVASLEAGGTIHRVSEVDASASLKTKLLKDASTSDEAVYDKDRNMGLPPGTPIAYNIQELKVNVNNGAIQLVLTKGSHGGFCDSIGYDEVDAMAIGIDGQDAGFINRQQLEIDLQHPCDIMKPLFEMPEAHSSQLNQDFQTLLSVPRDIIVLADIIRTEESSGQMVYKVSDIETKLITPSEVWLNMLRIAGYSIQEEKLTPPACQNAVKECIENFLDAATLLEDETLDLIRICPCQLANPLCSVLKDGIRGKTVSDPAIVQPLLANETAQKLLLNLEFSIAEAEIKAPAELNQAIDAAYWIILALWGRSFFGK